MKQTIKITLELPVEVVEKLQQVTDCEVKQLLEAELSVRNIDSFTERMGYNNW